MALEAAVLATGAKPLRNFVLKMASGATPSVVEFEKYYAENIEAGGIPFIRVQNLSETGELKLDDVKYINNDTHTGMLKRSQVDENDLVIKITGVGRMAVASVPPNGFTGNINQHSVVAKTESREVSEYVAAFLNSDIGEKLASRRSTGGTRPALDYPALRSIPVVFDERIFQKAKEAREAKAEKEAQAAKLLESIDDYLLSELGITLPPEPDNTIENRTFKTTFTKVSGNRLDPFFNRPELFESQLAVERGHFNTIRIREVCSLVRGVTYSQMDECSIETDIRILRANNIDLLTNELDFSSIRFLRNDFRISELNKLKRNDILMSIASGSKDHVGKVAFIENDMPYYFGGFMAVLRMKQIQFSPKFLFYFLQSKAFRRVLFRHLGGTNINNLNYSMISGINLPHPDYSTQLKLVEVLDSLKERYLTLKREAKADFELAKKEIEKLILN